MRASLLLSLALLACQPPGPLERPPAEDAIPRHRFAPWIDRAAALEVLARYENDFRAYERLSLRCRDADQCEAEPGCRADIAWGDDGLGGPPICEPDQAFVHGWSQARTRRGCLGSREGVYEVYQHTDDGRVYGACRCPPQSVASLVADGRIAFSAERGRCVSDRERCAGVFHGPPPAPEAQHLAAALVEPAHMSAFACESGSYGVDRETGYFAFGVWREDSGRCEVTVLRGYLEPHVAQSTDDPTPPGAMAFSVTRCDPAP